MKEACFTSLRLALLYVSVFAGAPCSAQRAMDKETEAGETAFLKTREAITEAHCLLHVKITSHQANVNSSSYKSEIWASGDKLRTDTTRNMRITDGANGAGANIEPDPNGTPQRDVVCKNGEQPGQYFQGSDNPRDLKYRGRIGSDIDRTRFLFHPRLIGCGGSGFETIHTMALHMTLCGADRADLRVGTETIRGVETVRLRWVNARQIQITTWLDPKRGYFPIQQEARATKNAADPAQAPHSICRVLEIAAAAGDRTLFPKRIKFEHYYAGNKLHKEEDVVVEEVEIGVKIDPAIFTVSGCKLGDAFLIQNTDTRKTAVWSEERKRTEPVPPERMRLVTADQRPSSHQTIPFIDTPVAVDPPPRRDWMYWLAGGLIAAATVWFVARIVAQRRAPA